MGSVGNGVTREKNQAHRARGGSERKNTAGIWNILGFGGSVLWKMQSMPKASPMLRKLRLSLSNLDTENHKAPWGLVLYATPQ
ncbi:hypothetical protein LEMLEM_LOCUS20767, partial [Lemmus lemmus]